MISNLDEYLGIDSKVLEKALTDILEDVDLLAIAHNLEGKIVYINPYFLLLSGYRKEEILGSDLYSSLEPKLQTKSGAVVEVFWSSTSLKNEEGNSVGLFSVGIDVTVRNTIQRLLEQSERTLKDRATQLEDKNKYLEDSRRAMFNLLDDAKALEEELQKEKFNVEKIVGERTHELKEEQARLLASINSVPKGLIIADNEGKILFTNKTVISILNADSRLWTLEGVQRYLGESVDLLKEFKRVHESGAPSKVSNIIFKTKYLEVYMSPILSNSVQNTIGIVVLIDDVTEAKVLERSKDEFFTIASHELRTPLTVIKGNSQLLKDKYVSMVSDVNFEEIVNDIHDSSVRLIEMVNEFLTTSSLEQGKIEFKKDKVNIITVVNNVIDELEITAHAKNLYLKYTSLKSQKMDGLTIVADANRVHEVLVNLVSNAISFTNSGGIKIETLKIPGMLKVEVIDTGKGISEKNQSLLFRKFQQANESLLIRDTKRGTGLGLYISKLLIEGMGGQIGLESSVEGKGSVFYFILPLANGA